MFNVLIFILKHWHEAIYISVALGFIWKSIRSHYHNEEENNKANKHKIDNHLLIILISFSMLTSYQCQQILSTINSYYEEVQLNEARNDVEKFKNIQKRLAPELNRIYGRHFELECNRIIEAIESQTITLNNIDEFRIAYKEALISYPNGEFLATSIPSKKYFWSDPLMAKAIEQFIKGGGKMSRLFFLENNNELYKDEVREIISNQLKMGITVYIINQEAIPKDMYKLFLVILHEKQTKIAWKAEINSSKEITEITATTNSEDITKYYKKFNDLVKLGYCEKVTLDHFSKTLSMR